MLLPIRPTIAAIAILAACAPARGTPANRRAFADFFGPFLSRRLDNCGACHLPVKPGTIPTSLADFPHNPFGHRLAILGDELRKAGKKADIATRIRLVSAEDSDEDGTDNLTEIL